MAPAKKKGYSDEHVAKKQKQKQDSFSNPDLGKIAARHLLEGDQEDVIQTFNGFKNEDKFGAFDVLEAEGMMFNYEGVVKDLFQLTTSLQEKPQEAGRKRKAWSSEEEGVLRQMIQESSDNIATKWFVENEVLPKHGKDGTISNILTNRTPDAIRMQLQKLSKTVKSTDESKLNAQLLDWPRPDDDEYEAFRNTPQIVTDLRSGVAGFTRGPIQMDALLTVCRVSQTNPVSGEEGLRENLRICRAVFLKDFQVEVDPAWSEDAVLAPKVPSATSWKSMTQSVATTGPAEKIKEMFRNLADLHESIPKGKKLELTILVLGFDGLTTNSFNFPFLEEQFPQLSITIVLMVGWRQLTNPKNPVLKDWEFSSRSRFAYGFYQLSELANTARRTSASPGAAKLLSVWAIVTAKKYDQAGTSFKKGLSINTRGRNDMGKDWVEWNTKRHQCRMCLYTSRDVEDLKSHWASNHADYFYIFCGINQNRAPMRRFKTLQELEEHQKECRLFELGNVEKLGNVEELGNANE